MATTTDIGALIVSTPETCGGRPRIAGTRIMVQNIATDHNAGMSPQQIVDEKPHLNLAQVYTALAYYYANQAKIDADIAAEDAEYDRLEAKYRSSKP